MPGELGYCFQKGQGRDLVLRSKVNAFFPVLTVFEYFFLFAQVSQDYFHIFALFGFLRNGLSYIIRFNVESVVVISHETFFCGVGLRCVLVSSRSGSHTCR